MIIDSQSHYDDERFDNDREELLLGLKDKNIEKIINVGYNLESSKRAVQFVNTYDFCYAAIGFHPSDASDCTEDALSELIELTKDPKVVCWGEIGLDYHYDNIDKESQKKLFVSQLELAKTLKLPVSIHSRDCTEDMLKLLKENKNLLEYGAVMHCFSGSLETAKILLNLGLFISFSGTLTFKNAKNLLEVADYLPLDKCLTETDSPYLSPEPFRGKLNEPKNVKFVLSKLAFIKNLSVEKMADIVLENTKNLFYKLKK
jgi:TatD DNase family protein